MDKFQRLKSIILDDFTTELEAAKIETCQNDHVVDITITATIKRGGICGKSVCRKKTDTNMKKILDETEKV